MPEVFYPGVYIVETGSHAQAIDGVPTSTQSVEAERLDAVRVPHLPVATPEWTDGNAHDPGVTMLEQFGWAAESLAFGVALALGLGSEAVSSSRRESAAVDPPP